VVAIERLGRLERMLAALPGKLRVRGNILAMSDALAQHAAYFDSTNAP
jgi:hypothetical protein